MRSIGSALSEACSTSHPLVTISLLSLLIVCKVTGIMDGYEGKFGVEQHPFG